MKQERKKPEKIEVTHSAVQRILEIMKEAPTKKGIRISIEGGGCSGFSYKFELAKEQTAEDTLIESQGAIILIDPLSLPYMKGCTIDFIDDLTGRSFRIDNPLATSSCGCGTSFSM